jgi:hypothetical protein
VDAKFIRFIHALEYGGAYTCVIVIATIDARYASHRDRFVAAV